MSEGTPLFESAINWIRKGYPEGVPPTEFPPLLALLTRVLDEREVTTVALNLARDHGVRNPVTEDQISEAIAKVTRESPTPDEINQVAGRLAAVGWPLAASSA
ncbi:DUF3349 domain-containing protein [Gordonia sp. OPL2]|uniref:DUF3349 domain-containing protein n=1 Tax=Gordonia sp. OPL2 TaxID=2486274 RepID=UPI0016566DAC|nr:DUF3349 domain-containing protein [Gordonia sp. OPL2]ROZ83435.1 DUF3349 domain-containing protein [Gordonia sp. OPL2]